jgi:sugar/nucleoside kinase (ribokinase family)
LLPEAAPVNRSHDVFGVGNALVDTVAFVDDDFIREHNLNRAAMTLADSEKQAMILQALSHHPLELKSGGSAANTMIGIARCGGTGFYTGKVARDPNGEFYRLDLIKAGIHFDIHPEPETSGATGTCIVMTTPDAERTMYTHLGVSVMLSERDIDVERIACSRYVYVEGYLWDAPDPRKACIKTLQEARRLGTKAAFTFSDPFLVNRYRADLHGVVRELCDVVFMNEEEAKAFTEIPDLQRSLEYLSSLKPEFYVTAGKDGAYVIKEGHIFSIPGFPVEAIDTNGAGDNFAAGVLFGLSHGYSSQASARLGNYVASKIVQVKGARLEIDLREKALEILRGFN